MIDLTKRSMLLLAAAITLAACGDKKEAAPPPARAAAAPKADPLKAAWVYAGPVADAGGSFAHDRARKAVEAHFADKVQTTFVENVRAGADAERVIRDLAAKGNKLIFATSVGFMESTAKVAAEFPDVKFEQVAGGKPADNLRVYEARSFESAYLAGVIAGRVTRSNTLGFVGSKPIPEVLRSINAFTLGAQSVNPRIRTQVAWVDAWFDPAKESTAAQALIDAGADVLLQSTDSTAVLQAAERNGKHAFGWNSDMSAFAPTAHLASGVLEWGPYYRKASQAVIDGDWAAARTVWGLREAQNQLVGISSAVPADARERVEKLVQGLKDGSFAPYTGPVVDNTGKSRLAAGAVADPAWLDAMDFYVKGVEGKVPSGR